jgi:phosphate transport system substrate-binding protein
VNTKSIRRALVPGVAALAIALAGCSAGNDDSSDASDGGSSSSSDSSADAGGDLSGTLNGGGSSAQEAAQGAWRAGFQSANSGATVNYDPVGSGTGRENFISGAYAFAGSDSALSTDEGELDSAKERCGGDDVIEIPSYVSPIAVIYNLDGVEGLQLSADTVAQIFDGKITKWNDAAIADENPDLDLPDTAITPVHRSDDSGTTGNFTDYLSKASDSWSYDPDGVWPIQGGEAAEGTSGLVAAVKAGAGAIGYADESQAGGLGIASLKVGDEYVAPSAEAAAKVVAVSPAAEGRSDSDMAVDVDRTTTESGAYPLILVSYLIACPTYDDANTAALVKGFASYVVSEEGQQAAAEQAGSAPLDSTLAEKAQGIVDAIS